MSYWTNKSIDYLNSIQMLFRSRKTQNTIYSYVNSKSSYNYMDSKAIENALCSNEAWIKDAVDINNVREIDLKNHKRYVYPYKDQNYYMWVYHKVFLSGSKTCFDKLFQYYMCQAGAKIITIENQGMNKEEKENILEEEKKNSKKVKIEEATLISEASDFTSNEERQVFILNYFFS